MTRSRLEIDSKDAISADAVIRLDGVEIQNTLRGVTLTMAVGEVTTAELEVAVLETTRVDSAEVEAFITDETRDLLIRLGWTPPEET